MQPQMQLHATSNATKNYSYFSKKINEVANVVAFGFKPYFCKKYQKILKWQKKNLKKVVCGNFSNNYIKISIVSIIFFPNFER